MEDRITRHHLLPRSKGGSNVPDNILKVRENKHRAFHTIFDNATPVAQLGRLSRFNSSALSPVFLNELNEVLGKYCGENELYAYKNGVLIPRQFLETL